MLGYHEGRAGGCRICSDDSLIATIVVPMEGGPRAAVRTDRGGIHDLVERNTSVCPRASGRRTEDATPTRTHFQGDLPRLREQRRMRFRFRDRQFDVHRSWFAGLPPLPRVMLLGAALAAVPADELFARRAEHTLGYDPPL